MLKGRGILINAKRGIRTKYICLYCLRLPSSHSLTYGSKSPNPCQQGPANVQNQGPGQSYFEAEGKYTNALPAAVEPSQTLTTTGIQATYPTLLTPFRYETCRPFAHATTTWICCLPNPLGERPVRLIDDACSSFRARETGYSVRV